MKLEYNSFYVFGSGMNKCVGQDLTILLFNKILHNIYKYYYLKCDQKNIAYIYYVLISRSDNFKIQLLKKNI